MILRQLRAKSRFAGRVAGLLLGIILGQGIVFLVQTVLVYEGRFAQTASLGFGLAMLSLVQWLADWGGLVLQARLSARGEPLRCIWETLVGRLLVVPVVTAAQLGSAGWLAGTDDLAHGILWGGAVVAPIWALNLSGYIDGRAMNGVGGPLAGLPWACAAAAAYVVLSRDAPGYEAGISIGLAYGLGCALCVMGQFAIAAREQISGSLFEVSLRGVLAFLADGGAYCVGELPGQFYGRALLLVVTQSFGPSTAGVYVYVRQIISAVAQTVMLVKRVEFPALSLVVTTKGAVSSLMFRTQVFGLLCSIAALGVSLCTLAYAIESPTWRFAPIAMQLPYFCIGLPIWAVAVTLGQALIILGKVRVYAIINFLVTAISTAVAVCISPFFNLAFLGFIDLAVFSTQALVYYWCFTIRRASIHPVALSYDQNTAP